MHIYWSPEFSDKKEELLNEMKEIVKKEYYDRRNTLHDDLFIVWKWILNPETNETYDIVPWKIWEKYDSHWIAKSNQLSNLLNLLDNWIDESRTFSTAPFELTNETKQKIASAIWTWWGTSYKDWIWVITSEYNKTIKEYWIKFVFINDIYWDLIGPLSELYPQFNFHLLSEQKNILEWASSVDKKLEFNKVPNYFYEWSSYFKSIFLDNWWEYKVSDYEKVLEQYDNLDIESIFINYNKKNPDSLKYDAQFDNAEWKIHLNVSPENVISVSKYLKNNWYYHKYISWWSLEHWKIFTIYVWSHKLVKKISWEISDDISNFLLKPKSTDEIELAKWVVWRFSYNNYNDDNFRNNWYWMHWFTLLKWRNYGSDNEKSIFWENLKNKSFNILYNKFWDYLYDWEK